jgi:hypothetical protein
METRLTYIEDFGRIKYPKSTVILVKCKCLCGNEIVVRKPHFLKNHTKSCGCLNKEKTSQINKTHNLSKSSTYRSWVAMIQRCVNKNIKQYKNYGNRGIKVCDSWLKFDNFLLDMGIKPNDDFQIDRIDNNGNYEKNNCKWSSRIENCNNKNNNVKYNYKGELLSVTEISRRSGITRSRISSWKNRSNYSVEKIEMLIEKYLKND